MSGIRSKKNKKTVVRLTVRSRWAVLMLALGLCLPMVWGIFFTDHGQRSRFENRALETFPKPGLILSPKAYFTQLDQFITDHMGFAVVLNRLYRKGVFYLFHESTVKNLSVTREGYVFLTSHDSNAYNRVFKDLCRPRHRTELDALLTRIDEISRVVESFGHRAIFAAAMTKPGLYPEYLPPDVSERERQDCQNFLNKDNILKQLQTESGKKEILFHYPFEAFIAFKQTPHFYPKENFHWNGMSAHLFAKTFFETLGHTVGENFEAGKHLVKATADLHMIGFDREIMVWDFPYPGFQVRGGGGHSRLIPFKKEFPRLTDCSYYETEHPFQDKDAVLFSDSFGAAVARHLATGYRTLIHFNIFNVRDSEKKAFYKKVLQSGRAMDIIFLFHDGGIVYRPTLKDIATQLKGLKPAGNKN